MKTAGRRRPIRAPFVSSIAPAVLLALVGLAAGTTSSSVARASTPEASVWTIHTRLVSSVPASDDTVRAFLERFRLVFSSEVNAQLSSLELEVPGGEAAKLTPYSSDDSAHVLLADAPLLAAGRHTLRWQTVSVDGHPVSGTITFHVAEEAASVVDAVAVQAGSEAEVDAGAAEVEAGTEAVAEAAVDADERPGLGETLVGGLGMALLLAFAGLLWFTGTGALAAESRLRRAALVLGTGAAVLMALGLATWTAQVTPPGSGLDGLGTALGTRSGVVGLVKLLLVVVAVLSLLGSRGRAAAFLALLAVVAGALSGHPAGISPYVAVPANGLHLGAAAIWAGGLSLLILCPDGPSIEAEDDSDRWRYRDVAKAVSAAALLAVLLVTGSGIVQSFLFVGGLGEYFGTRYGWAVVLKVIGLVALVLFGAYHRLRLLPAVRSGEDPHGGSLRRSVRLEMIVMLLVVLLAAYLARITPPAGH